MTILIIDDDPFFLSDLQNAFEMQGYNVIAATNTLEASVLFFQYQPRAVILDVFLSDRDGFSLLKEIKELYQKISILAVSTDKLYLQLEKNDTEPGVKIKQASGLARAGQSDVFLNVLASAPT